MGGPRATADATQSLSGNPSPLPATVGVLALQGAFSNHEAAFQKLSVEIPVQVRQVRSGIELSECDALVIPGGESTTMNILLCSDGESLLSAVRDFVHVLKRPVWGTCAGCILLANKVLRCDYGGEVADAPSDKREGDEESKTDKGIVSGIDIAVSRNYFGRQANSFEAPLTPKGRLQGYLTSGFPAICIRAPGIVDVGRDSIEVLATLPSPRDEGKHAIAAAAQNGILVSIFHPELTGQNSFHRFFIEAFVLPSLSRR